MVFVGRLIGCLGPRLGSALWILTSTSCRIVGLSAGQEAREPQPSNKILFRFRDLKEVRRSWNWSSLLHPWYTTINASILPSVVRIQSSQTGWSVDVQINRFSKLEQGDVVWGGLRWVVVLVDNWVNLQCYIFPKQPLIFLFPDQLLNLKLTCLCQSCPRYCWGQTRQEAQWGRLLRSILDPWLRRSEPMN